MSRVSSITKRFDGKRAYTSVFLPKIPLSDSDLYIIVGEDVTLDVLAQKYYNNSSLWWIIAKANKIGMGYNVGKNTQLRIPKNIERFI